MAVRWFDLCAGRAGDIETVVAEFAACLRAPTAAVSSGPAEARLRDRRRVFLAYCLIDAGREVEGVTLLRSVVGSSDSLSDSPDPDDRRTRRAAVMEMKLVADDNKDIPSSRQVISTYGASVGYTDPLQRPGYLHPSLPSSPFWATSSIPLAVAIETPGNFEVIEEECRGVEREWREVGGGTHRDGGGEHDKTVLVGDWKEVVLFGTGGDSTLAPRTAEILKKAGGADFLTLCESGGGEVIFSRLAAGSRILPHCAPSNCRLTVHLGIEVPEETGETEETQSCAIRVGSTWRQWKRGECLVFDDSYEHEVRNLTPHPRTVLLLRVWHPGLDTEEKRREATEGGRREREGALRDRWVPPLDLLRGGNGRLNEHLPVKEPEEDVEWNQREPCARNGDGRCRFSVRRKEGAGRVGGLVLVCACGRDRVAEEGGEREVVNK